MMMKLGFFVVSLVVGLVVCEKELGSFSTLQHQLAGKVCAINERVVEVRGMNYDGQGPAAYFWGDRGSTPSSQGFRLLDANGSCGVDPLPAADGTRTFVVEFPPGVGVSDLGSLSVWCEDFDVSFGDVKFSVDPLPEPQAPLKCSRSSSSPLPTPAPSVRPSDENCEPLSSRFFVRWKLEPPNIRITLEAKIQDNLYMGFGPSGSPNRTNMDGSDVVIAYKRGTEYVANDYYLAGRSQCSQGTGVCPDTASTASGSPGTNDVTNVSGRIEGDMIQITYSRPIAASDKVHDKAFLTSPGAVTFISWALGPVSADTGFPQFHDIEVPRGDVSFVFGRPPVDNCPKQGLEGPTETVKPWERPYIVNETRLVARIGPSGGPRGYGGITGRSGWGIAWYINDILIPVIGVERGKKYTFVSQGGNDRSNSGKYHPLYLTTSISGGYAQIPPSNRSQEEVILGIEDIQSNASGVFDWTVTGDGQLCEYSTTTATDLNASTFEEFFATLNRSCGNSQEISAGAKELTWTPDESTPDILYYQCVTHRNLGWIIRVFDSGKTDEKVLQELSAPSTSLTPAATMSPTPSANMSGGSPTPSPTNGDGVCFPSSAVVELENGEHIPMEKLELGDRVRVGINDFSEVFFFGHRDPHLVHEFVSLQTRGLGALELSRNHLVHVRHGSRVETIPAYRVKPGMRLVDKRGSSVVIDSIGIVHRRGLYNPHTLDGNIVVNGFQVSCFTTMIPPSLANALLLPERLAHRYGLSLTGNAFEVTRPWMVQQILNSALLKIAI